MPSILNATTNSGLVTSADNSGSLQLQTNNGTTAVTIDTSQNVGIGTSSPSSKLDVNGAITTTLITTADNASGTNTFGRFSAGFPWSLFRPTATSNGFEFRDNSGNALYNITQTTGSQNHIWTTAATERMRITDGGELLIGRTSGLNARLGITSSSGACSINCGDAVDTTDYGIIQIVRAANQPDNKFHLSFIRSGNKIAGMGFLDNSDTLAIQNASSNAGAGVTLTNAATSWGTTSDERKKDIIAPIENALTKLSDWRSVYYKYKNDEADAPQRVGLIAQDVQATLPEAVSVEEDEIKTLQLRYTETIPLLVKAIQEQQAMIEELKTELDTVKAELNTLKNPPVEGTE